MKLPGLSKFSRPAKIAAAAALLLGLFGVVGTTGGLTPRDYVSRNLVDEIRYRIQGREMRFTLTCPTAPSLRYAVARGRDRREAAAFVESRLPGCKLADAASPQGSR